MSAQTTVFSKTLSHNQSNIEKFYNKNRFKEFNGFLPLQNTFEGMFQSEGKIRPKRRQGINNL